MKCPVCTKHLVAVLIPHQNGMAERGVRCLDSLCAFNFSDQECKICGAEVRSVSVEKQGAYHVTCHQGHSWSVPLTSWVSW